MGSSSAIYVDVSNNTSNLPRWNLDDLYLSMEDPAIKRDFTYLRESAEEFSNKYKNKVTELLQNDPDALVDAIVKYEDICCIFTRIATYASLLYHQDATDPLRVQFLGNVQNDITEISSLLVFFLLELNTLDMCVLNTHASNHIKLAHYIPWLNKLRKTREYQLSHELESYIHDMDTVTWSSWCRLFDDTWAQQVFEINGGTCSLEEVLATMTLNDREARREAARVLSERFYEKRELFTIILNTLTKAKAVQSHWRKYPLPQSSRHIANDVEPEVVQALRDSTVEAYERISHRYYLLKTKWLGLDKLEFWDRNAPIVCEGEVTYSWDEARDIVLSGFADFHPRMHDIAQRFFQNGWIDAAVTPGKSPGAFAHPASNDTHPFVMMNFIGKPRDVMTLAHELGHGVHQILAKEQGELLSSTPLTLAETASVFGEMLVFRKLLNQETRPAHRRALIANKVEDAINTLVRQIAFYDFESRVHIERAKKELTSEDFGDIWMEVQKESLGPAFNYPEEYRNYWCYIPHFIRTPFYVYAYAFGYGLVSALFKLYETGYDDFHNKYFDMLRSGGRHHHSDLLKPFNLDASKKEFWSLGHQLVDELVSMLHEQE